MTTPDAGQQRKRFYQDVSVAAAGTDGETPSFRILLDNRALRTPARRELAVPVRPLAEAIAAEWRAQGAAIDPLAMPLTRIVNSAIDGVAGRETEVRTAILAYGQSDLVCYFAEHPPELIDRQSRRWGAIHAWAKTRLGVELELAVGVMPVEQSPDQLALLDRALGPHSALSLAAMHVLTTLTGSLLLALAVQYRRVDAAEAWALAHIDEDFQIEKWGEDAEAAGKRAARWREMDAAATLLLHVGD